MLSCHRSVILRSLTLLGLVVLFVACGGDAWAAFVASSPDSVPALTFPYLSPDVTQRDLLTNAFVFQMNLFGAINGTQTSANPSGLAALSYLAMTGCLIGALLTIFNPKYRKMPIMASWLLLVIITVFAPYGSKLLFYPVVKDAMTEYGMSPQSGQVVIPKDAVEDCKGNNAMRCGFTPQLGAIHVAATLQLTFSEIFKSLGWDGMMQRMEADTRLKGAEELVMQDDYYKQWVPRYLDRCGDSLTFDKLAGIYTGVEEPPADLVAGKEPATIGEMMKDLRTFYAGEINNSAPPPVMVLYDEGEFNQMKEKNGWNDEVENRYDRGLTELYRGVMGIGDSTKGVKVQCDDDATCIKPSVALQAMDANGFFQVTDSLGNDIAPGFLFKWKGAQNYGTFSQVTPDFARRCYGPQTSADGSIVDATGMQPLVQCGGNAMNTMGPISTLPQSQQSSFLGLAGGDQSRLTDSTGWGRISGVLSTDPNTPILSMPVGRGVYGPTNKNMEEPPVPVLLSDDGSSGEGMGQGNVDCVRDGKNLITGIIDSTFAAGGKASNYDALAQLLKTGGVPEVFTREQITNLGEDAGTPQFKQRVVDLITSMNGVLIDAKNSGVDVSDEGQRWNVVLKSFLRKSVESSKKSIEGTTSDAERAEGPEVVGNKHLTWLGGSIATFLGTWLVNIGAFFVGPLAAALIYFLSILVDIAMMALIVLTPFLFMAGLFVPSMAVGVLSVAVLGAFVLKFVPVTLIILNSLGMMIYQFIGAGAKGDEADIMQSLIIIAMAGLYANLVGMTFFLLFKLGDPAAILGRFTALDGAAKDMAERGMAATIAVAAAAAAGVAGGVYAGAGRFSLGRAMEKAGEKLGVPKGAIEAMKQATQSEETTQPTAAGKARTEKEKEILNSPNADLMRDQLINEFDMTKEEADDAILNKAFKDKDGNDFDIDRRGEKWSAQRRPLDGITALEERDTHTQYEERGPASDRTRRTDLQEQSSETAMQDTSAGQGGEEAQSSDASQPGDAPPGFRRMGEQQQESKLLTPQEGLQQDQLRRQKEMLAKNQEQQKAQQLSEQPAAEGQGMQQMQQQQQQAQAGGGAPVNVNVTGGSLGSVAEVGKLSEVPSDMSQRAAEIRAQEDAKLQADSLKKAEEISKSKDLSEATKGVIAEQIDVLKNAKSAEEVEAANKKIDETLREKEGKSAQQLLGGEAYRRNMNDQIGDELTRVGKLMDAETDKKSSRYQDLEAYKKKLLSLDPVALTQGQLMKEMGTVEEMKQALAFRGAADQTPGYMKTMLSGVYGAAAGTGGGLARIPILGPAIAETLNEFSQAPERARAWQAAGGFWKWREANTNAQRLGHYQKEMGPLAAGTQYENMLATGAFQAQADVARQAASEAVAKSRSQFEAMVENARQNPMGGPGESRIYMSAGELSGLGRMEAADRIASVRQESFLMQSNPLVVQVAKQGLNGEMQLKRGTDGKLEVEVEDHHVVLTPQALGKLRGDLATKQIANSFDEMMINHYGLAEKQYLRGDAEWNRARNMNRSAADAAAFARKDVSTDYLIGGHLKMVQGKERFLEGRGQYETLVKFRHESNAKIAEYAQQNAVTLSAKLDQAKLSGLSGSALATNYRMEIEKLAAKELKAQNAYVPLNLIFDSASTNGASKYILKARKARAEIASEEDDIKDSVEKARVSQIESLVKLSKASMKAVTGEHRGLKFDIGKTASAKLMDSFNDAFGESVEQINDMMANVINQAAEKNPARGHELASKLLVAEREILKDKKGTKIGVSGRAYMDKEFEAELRAQMSERQRAQLDAAIREGRSMRRAADGNLELASFYMREEGNNVIKDEFNN